jgi:hypothetical protein
MQSFILIYIYYLNTFLKYFEGADWKIKDAEGNTALHLCMTGRRTNELVSIVYQCKKNIFHATMKVYNK